MQPTARFVLELGPVPLNPPGKQPLVLRMAQLVYLVERVGIPFRFRGAVGEPYDRERAWEFFLLIFSCLSISLVKRHSLLTMLIKSSRVGSDFMGSLAALFLKLRAFFFFF